MVEYSLKIIGAPGPKRKEAPDPNGRRHQVPTGRKHLIQPEGNTRGRWDAEPAELAIFAEMAREKTYVDARLGQVTVRKSRQARRISIRVTPGKGVVVTVPYWVPYRVGEAFLLSRKDWAEQALRRMEDRVKDALEMSDTKDMDSHEGTTNSQVNLDAKIEQWRKTAKETLPLRLAELALRYGFSYRRVTIKHNRSNWGSCSTKGNINLNLNLVRLPKELQDYVMLHELCHLRHMDHGTEFHRLLEELCRREMPPGGMLTDGDRNGNSNDDNVKSKDDSINSKDDDITESKNGNIKESKECNGKEAPLHEKLRKELKSYILL